MPSCAQSSRGQPYEGVGWGEWEAVPERPSTQSLSWTAAGVCSRSLLPSPNTASPRRTLPCILPWSPYNLRNMVIRLENNSSLFHTCVFASAQDCLEKFAHPIVIV